jgi:hypothetical protein
MAVMIPASCLKMLQDLKNGQNKPYPSQTTAMITHRPSQAKTDFRQNVRHGSIRIGRLSLSRYFKAI